MSGNSRAAGGLRKRGPTSPAEVGRSLSAKIERVNALDRAFLPPRCSSNLLRRGGAQTACPKTNSPQRVAVFIWCYDFNIMKYIIGIDEVGRGSLAGPVVVSAVAIPKKLVLRNEKLGRLRDSKKLSAKQREAWAAYLRNHPKVFYTLARVYPKTIDRINISRAANLAALRAFRGLCVKCQVSGIKCQVFLDGGLFLGNKKRQVAKSKEQGVRTIVRGDEKIKAVAAASIVAKVHRDGFMKRLAKKYPRYGLEIHKGYGTKTHRAALRRYGPSEVHRRSFIG